MTTPSLNFIAKYNSIYKHNKLTYEQTELIELLFQIFPANFLIQVEGLGEFIIYTGWLKGEQITQLHDAGFSLDCDYHLRNNLVRENCVKISVY